jgi:hypothetical protein
MVYSLVSKIVFVESFFIFCQTLIQYDLLTLYALQ